MVVYADLYFLANFGLDYFLLWATARLGGRRASRWRLGLGAAAGGCYALLIFLPGAGPWLGVGGRIAASLGMLLAAFYPMPRVAWWRLVAWFYAAAFTTAGAMLGVAALAGDLRLPLAWYVLLPGLAAAGLGLGGLAAHLERHGRRVDGYLTVELVLEGRVVRLRGLVDTAHRLVDPFSRRPVLVAEFVALSPLFTPEMRRFFRQGQGMAPADEPWAARVRAVPFTSLGTAGGLLLAFRPDEVRCGGVAREALVGVTLVRLSPGGSYQALLPPSLAGELSAA